MTTTTILAMDVGASAGSIGSSLTYAKSVGFLVSQLGAIVARQFAAVVAAVGIEPRDFALMMTISTAAVTTQNALSERLGIPASTLVAVVDRLEERSLVERLANPNDRRSRVLHLTDRGSEVLADAAERAMVLEDQLCAGLSPQARGELISALDAVAANLHLGPGNHPGVESNGHAASD